MAWTWKGWSPVKILDGIAAAVGDVQAGVTAFKTADIDFNRCETLRHIAEIQRNNPCRVHAAGAADIDRPELFGVDIYHAFSGDEAGLQALGARQSRLLVHG